jgi:hypothetical protein
MISSADVVDRTRADRHSRSSRALLYAGTITETSATDVDLRQTSFDSFEDAVRVSASLAQYQPACSKSTSASPSSGKYHELTRARVRGSQSNHAGHRAA